jgi:hypothetical protein
MFFKYSYEVLGLRTHVPDGAGLEFRFDKPNSVIVRLTRDYQSGRAAVDPSSATCVAETMEQPTDTTIASELDLGLASSLEGQWAVLKNASPSTVKFLDDILGELKRIIVATVSVFRWFIRCWRVRWRVPEQNDRPRRGRHWRSGCDGLSQAEAMNLGSCCKLPITLIDPDFGEGKAQACVNA